MKKLNILLIALVSIIISLIIVACYRSTDTTTERHRIDDEVGTIKKFEFEGHTYLIRDFGSRGGICHDENCKCKTDSIK